MLLDNGASVNQLNAENETPLLLASYYGHLEIVEELLLRSADMFTGPSLDGACCVGAANKMGYTAPNEVSERR